MTDLNGRIALVTGASRGIGYFSALELARAGAHIVAVARTVGGLEELDDAIQAEGGSATLVPQDLTDMKSIDALGGAIHERWGKLDILVANAAMLGPLSPIGHFEARTFDKIMTLNVTSTWRVIRSVEPLLMKSDAGRAIILTASAGYQPKPFWGAYGASKAAVQAMAQSWALEVAKTTLRVNCFDPGPSRTAMRALAMPGEDPQDVPHPSETAKKLMRLADPNLQETGMLLDGAQDRFLSFRAPD